MMPASHDKIEDISESEFAKGIVEAIKNGYAFVPFVGAGFSVASGIPAIPAMYRYLEYCMLAVFGLVPERRRIPWVPRQEPWPTLASWTSEDLPTSGRILQIWQQALERHPKNMRLREAFGALADWRSVLRFFSRIDSVTPSNNEGEPAEVHLGASDPSIIDSFFRALMENRRPALTHKMLHSLSTVLRCDVLLTTNFDDLIEKAFLEAGSPLSVYEVPSHDPLPTAGLVLRERTLVKLHGGKFWLRADDTLDESPSREDIRNFLGYLAGRPLRSNPQAVGDDLGIVNEATALLVCGLSASDQRIKHLLAYALAWMPNLRVFWLGFAPSDADAATKVAGLAHEYTKKRTELSRTGVAAQSMRERVFIHLCPNAGLFCLRLFQELAHSLPPSGAIFPSLWKMPSPPRFFSPLGYNSKQHRDSAISGKPTNDLESFVQQLQKLRLHIRQKFRGYARGDLQATLPPILVEVAEKCSGGLSLAQELHHEDGWGQPDNSECSGGFLDPVHAIWIDLDDVVQPAGFFLRLSLMIASACGEHDPISRLDIEDYYRTQHDYESFCRSIADGINRLTRESGAMWLVTVNAKENPGCNSLFHHEQISIDPDRSPSRTENRWQREIYSLRFADTIHYLVEQRRLPIQFVFVSRTSQHDNPSHVCLRALWTMFGPPKQQSWIIEKKYLGLREVQKLADLAVERIQAPIDQAPGQPEWEACFRYLIAYAIALFRIARYRVALSEILQRLARHLVDFDVMPGGDLDKVSNLLNNELAVYLGDYRDTAKSDDDRAKVGLVREKQGGFLWMHLEERTHLLKSLHQMLQSLPANSTAKRVLAKLTLRLHWYVARWYGRLLLSSLDPLAVGQAVDHIFRGLEFAATFRNELFTEQPSNAEDVSKGVVPARNSVAWEKTPSVRRLPTVMIRHARHVLGVAEPLFGRRLSDQFANLALEALLTNGLDAVRKRFETLRSDSLFVSVFARVLPELDRLELQILRMYSTLQRRSGRFNEFLGKRGTAAIQDRIGALRKRLKIDGDSGGQPTGDRDENTDIAACRSELCSIEFDLANCLLCSRRYEASGDQLYQTLTDIIEPRKGRSETRPRSANGLDDPEKLKKLRDKILDWSVASKKTKKGPPERALGEAVHALERLMYLDMHRSQSSYLARDAALQLMKGRGQNVSDPMPEALFSRLDPVLKDIQKRVKSLSEKPKEGRCQLLKKALVWGEIGLALLRHLTITDGQRVYVDNVRLRTHSALCEALFVANTDGKDIQERLKSAKRFLSEAQAYLDEFPLKHAGKLRAVFELRCAEISILEASITLPKESSHQPVKESLAPNNETDPFRQGLAHIYDSLRAVKRAEIVLEEHRKSRWWWWILLVLKVKACEYLYRVRWLGLKEWETRTNRNLAEALDSKEEAEKKLRELAEMTRQLPPFALQFLRDELHAKVTDAQMTDPMFMARIVHSFRMICTYDLRFEQTFLRCWNQLNGTNQPPGGRGDRARVRLTRARTTLRGLAERLEAIWESITNSDANEEDPKNRMDLDTLDYAKLVILQAKWDVEHEVIWKA